jgi:hypothetical protein
MATVPLSDFIRVYRYELIRRCEETLVARSPSTHTQNEHGVPLFLDQLVSELRHGESEMHEISKTAADHGRELFQKGVTAAEVVHGYGDVCQAITGLALEMDASIETGDFRVMNRCLDDAIASAVTEYAGGQAGEAGDCESDQLRILTDAAITAFEVLQAGRVGVTGSTGGVLQRTLKGLRALADRQNDKVVQGRSRVLVLRLVE